jgi:CHAD domain-containing protein
MKSSESQVAPETTLQLAQRVFAELYETIRDREPSVRLGDVEAIHDMRVATRRLRVALSNFSPCWTKEERRQIKFWLQSLADALGEVRDLDVLMESLRSKQTALSPAERLLLTNLLERLRKQRKRRFQTLLLYLESDPYLGFKRDFPRTFTARSSAAAA